MAYSSKLDGGLGARLAVVEKRGVPADYRQVVGIVGNAGLQNLVALAFGKLGGFSAHDLRDASALGGAQLGGGGRARNLPDVENKVVLTQPLRIGLDQRRRRPLQLLADDAGRVLLKVHVPDPAAAHADQGVPVAGKRQLEDHAQHAVVVILDLAFQALATVQDQGFDGLDHRRPLVANVSRSGVLEAGLLQGAGAKNLPQLVEPDLFANVELDKDEDRPAQRRLEPPVCAMRVGLGQVKDDFGV